MTTQTNRPLTREEERQIVAYLANSDELAKIAAADLREREAKRNSVLAELAKELPALERACKESADRADKASKLLEKIRRELQDASTTWNEARIRAGSAQSVLEKRMAKAHRMAAELADPRIFDLRHWVLRLEGEVRSEPIEISLTVGAPRHIREQIEADAATKANAASTAMTRLDAIATELAGLLVSPYGSELGDVLIQKQEEAQEIAAGVIAAHRFEILMESAPDMSRLPLPRV